MKTDLPFEHIVHLHKNRDRPHVYDVDLVGFERLQGYDQVECHTVLYPYSREVGASDIAFYPFEEYVRDVQSQQRSAYAAIDSHFHELFGLGLGLIIALAFALFNPQELLGIEAIVSVFGAYVIGKELWGDIEQALINLSKNWRLRLQDSYYRYRLEKHTTLTTYSYLAKERRYGKVMLLPDKIDFIKQSNSQTLRMCFDTRDLPVDPGEQAHIHSIHIDRDHLAAFEEDGFMFGVKLSLNRRFLCFTRNLELFQSIDGQNKGCLDQRGEWIERAVFYRHTLTCARLKYYAHQGIICDRIIVDCMTS